MNNIFFVDIETDRTGKVIIIGIMDCNGIYFYFRDIKDFYNFYNNTNKGTKFYTYNLEFDFFRIIQELLFNNNYNYKVKFNSFWNTAGCIYAILNGKYWFDLMLHYGEGLKKFGDIIGKNKLQIDYNNMKFDDKLIEYNKRDLELTVKMYEMIRTIYSREGLNKITATISSASFKIFNNRFYGGNYKKINDNVINEWRRGYKGGWCEVFKEGIYKGKFYYVDVNSLYPFVMLQDYPEPYIYEIIYLDNSNIKKIYNEIIKNNYYWLGYRYDNDYVWNSVESDYFNFKNCHYIYIFRKKVYPFRNFISYFHNKKNNAENKFERYIYKRLMNSLYGKFGQKSVIERLCISDMNKILKIKNLISYEEVIKNIYRIEYETKVKYYNNVLWSLFTTAKARKKMKDDYNEFMRRGINIYYVDTDAFIIDNVEKMMDYIGEGIGEYKIEKECNILEIKGKKLYRINNDYVCKGVPKEYAKEFFEKGIIEYEKMVRVKTALRTNKRIGENIKALKKNKSN